MLSEVSLTATVALPRMPAMSRNKRGSLGLCLATCCLPLMAACTPDEDLGVREDIFGSIHFRLERAANLPATPFVDTATVEAHVTMGQCLDDFYKSNSEWALDGKKGSKVGEAWLDILCDRSFFPDVFRCEADSHTWTPGGGVGGRAQMQVTFTAVHPDLENFDIRIGPIANEDHAGCEPEVSLDLDTVTGYKANGDVAWRIETTGTEMAWQGNTTTAIVDENEGPKVLIERAD